MEQLDRITTNVARLNGEPCIRDLRLTVRRVLDHGLPRSTVLHLQNHGVDAVHVGDKGLATATDSKILDVGRQEGMAVVTLDADFHALLALSGVTGPSVIASGLKA